MARNQDTWVVSLWGGGASLGAVHPEILTIGLQMTYFISVEKLPLYKLGSMAQS